MPDAFTDRFGSGLPQFSPNLPQQTPQKTGQLFSLPNAPQQPLPVSPDVQRKALLDYLKSQGMR